MGISSEHIILYGWNVSYDTISDLDTDTFEEYHYRNVDEGDVAIVADGMRAEYALVGVLQFCSEDRRWGQANIPLQRAGDITEDQKHSLLDVAQELDLRTDLYNADNYVLTHHS